MLNPQQQQAVDLVNGPLLVVAGAGSGKTTVLTQRIANLIQNHGVSPLRILAITFTNKAAKEMKERVHSTIGEEIGALGVSTNSMWISTFHAACVKILRYEAEKIDFPGGFSIFDSGDSLRLIENIRKDLGYDPKLVNSRSVRSVISGWKNNLVGIEEATAKAFVPPEKVNALFYKEYQRQLHMNKAMDFDDLLFNTAMLFREQPEVLEKWQRRFDYVHIDEFQDTNIAQWEIVRKLCSNHHNLMVVGDSDQSIYKFRGADYRNIARFEEAFPKREIILLEENYRSSQNILDASNAVIKNNTSHREKTLYTKKGKGEKISVYIGSNERDEARFVIGESQRLVDEATCQWKDIAVFYRTNAQSRVLEEGLVTQGIPYKIVGATKFYDRKEVRDILAYIKVCANPSDTLSWSRALSAPRRGIGPKTIDKISSFATSNGIDFGTACFDHIHSIVSGKAGKAIAKFADVIKKAMAIFLESTEEAVAYLLENSGLKQELQDENTVESAGRLENLNEFLSVATTFDTTYEILYANDDILEEGEKPITKLDAFLQHVALVSGDDGEEADSAITLMTVHSAKGLEFDVVFLVGFEDGIFPHVRSINDSDEMEEERRLCYVALTRARHRLYLLHVWQRMLYGNTNAFPPSRFLAEIPAELMDVHSNSMQSNQNQSDFRRDSESSYSGFNYQEKVGTPVRNQTMMERMASKAAPVESTIFKVGEDVSHAKYGSGVVLDVTRSASDSLIRVNFSKIGEKTFLSSMSNLEKA